MLFTILIPAVLGVAGTLGVVLGGTFILAILVLGVVLGVRRLHDIDRTGWWLLMPIGLAVVGAVLGGLVVSAASGTRAGNVAAPALAALGLILGNLALLVLACPEGTRGSTRFGPDPRDPASGRNLEAVFR